MQNVVLGQYILLITLIQYYIGERYLSTTFNKYTKCNLGVIQSVKAEVRHRQIEQRKEDERGEMAQRRQNGGNAVEQEVGFEAEDNSRRRKGSEDSDITELDETNYLGRDLFKARDRASAQCNFVCCFCCCMFIIITLYAFTVKRVVDVLNQEEELTFQPTLSPTFEPTFAPTLSPLFNSSDF